MNLGVIYNFFDGEELLEQSINQIRDQSNIIILVYQRTSNWGIPITKEALHLVKKLVKSGKVDKAIEYVPKRMDPAHISELNKRNTGLAECKKFKCSHFMHMDADEFYTKEQFALAKKTIEDTDSDIGFCLFHNYFKSPSYQEVDTRGFYKMPSGSQRTCVAIMTKLTSDTACVLGAYDSRGMKILVDPTRQALPIRRIYLFNPKEVIMHHMSWVRRDIRSKLYNSTCRENSGFEKKIKGAIKLYPNWKPGDRMPFAPKKIHIVPNYFHISI